MWCAKMFLLTVYQFSSEMCVFVFAWIHHWIQMMAVLLYATDKSIETYINKHCIHTLKTFFQFHPKIHIFILWYFYFSLFLSICVCVVAWERFFFVLVQRTSSIASDRWSHSKDENIYLINEVEYLVFLLLLIEYSHRHAIFAIYFKLTYLTDVRWQILWHTVALSKRHNENVILTNIPVQLHDTLLNHIPLLWKYSHFKKRTIVNAFLFTLWQGTSRKWRKMQSTWRTK